MQSYFTNARGKGFRQLLDCGHVSAPNYPAYSTIDTGRRLTVGCLPSLQLRLVDVWGKKISEARNIASAGAAAWLASGSEEAFRGDRSDKTTVLVDRTRSEQVRMDLQ